MSTTQAAPATTELPEPVSVHEARELRDNLLHDIQQIQAQLANDEDFSNGEYTDWRRRAKHALAFKMRDYRRVKEWIADHAGDRRTERDAILDTTVPNIIESAKVTQKSIGRLLNIYASLRAWMDHDTDEAWDRLRESVRDFEEFAGVGS